MGYAAEYCAESDRVSCARGTKSSSRRRNDSASTLHPHTHFSIHERRVSTRTFVLLLALFFALACAIARADQNWDGDNPVGNFSYDNNWFGNTQPSWGFGGSLHFSYHNNASQTSVYDDYSAWVQTDNIYFDTTFGASTTLDSNGVGIDFNQRIENDSSFAQTINLPTSGNKNGAGHIELNPVSGDLTLNGAIYNDTSVGYQVWGNNGKTLNVNTSLGVGANAAAVSFTVEQNSVVNLNAAQTYAGGTFVSAGTLLVNNASGSGTGSGKVIVNSGGTLGGTGTIDNTSAGNTVVANGGTITGAAVGTVGTLTLNTQTLQFGDASIYRVDLNATTSDLLSITGAFSANGVGDTIQFNSLATPSASSYTLATYTSWDGTTFDNVASLPSGYQLVYGSTALTLTAVPEPSTWFAAVLAVVTVAVTQRRHFRRRRTSSL